MANHWTDSKVEAAVEDYFNMLRLELFGRKYNKTQHRRALMGRLNNRSDGSVELKHQNISAVLIEMGIPYIDGYKPRFNYQRSLLPAAVADYLRNKPEIQALFQADVGLAPSVPTVDDFLSAMEKPPVPEGQKSPAVAQPRVIYNPVGVNYLERKRGTNRLVRLVSSSSLTSNALA